MYQPSDHFGTLVQDQHKSLQKIQELNTNDLSFTLDGVLSTLQQGSSENGVGSSVELCYHVEKGPCHMLTSGSLFSPQTQHNQSKENTNTTNKQTKHSKTHKARRTKLCSCPLCWSVLCQVMWHSSFCSWNKLLTPVIRADASTCKLYSKFPVNKPQTLHLKVCRHYSSS